MITINQITSIVSLVIALASISIALYARKNSKKQCNHKIMDESLFKNELLLDVESSVIAQTNITNQDGTLITFYYAGADSYEMDVKSGFAHVYEGDKIVASLMIKDVQLITVNKTPGGASNE